MIANLEPRSENRYLVTMSDAENPEQGLDGLSAKIQNASPELLKAGLEHTTKMLDHVYAANDAISQKARWAIGIIAAVMVVLLRQTVSEADAPSGDKTAMLVYALYGTLLVILAASLGTFLYITRVETHFHSGIKPSDVPWAAYIRDGQQLFTQLGKTSPPNTYDHAYFVESLMAEYEDRITKGRTLNKRIAFGFNLGLFLLVLGLGWWIFSYLWLNG